LNHSSSFIQVLRKLADYLMTYSLYSDDRTVKRAKTDHDNHPSANGDVTQSSATVLTQQQVIQTTAAADVVPAYTYAPTWPGYAVCFEFCHMSVLYFYLCKGGDVLPDVCLFVCLLATSRKNYSSDHHENFTRDVTLDREDTIKSSASRS